VPHCAQGPRTASVNGAENAVNGQESGEPNRKRVRDARLCEASQRVRDHIGELAP